MTHQTKLSPLPAASCLDALTNAHIAAVLLADDGSESRASEEAIRLCDRVGQMQGLTRREVLRDFWTAFQAEKGRRRFTIRALGPEGPLCVEVVTGKPVTQNGQLWHLLFLVPMEPGDRGPSLFPYVVGPLRVDANTGYVMWNREYLDLTDNEFRVLVHLIRRADEPVSKKELLQKVWGSRSSSSRVMDITVSRLRQKFADAGAPKDLIKTLHGKGYQFQAWDLAESSRHLQPSH